MYYVVQQPVKFQIVEMGDTIPAGSSIMDIFFDNNSRTYKVAVFVPVEEKATAPVKGSKDLGAAGIIRLRKKKEDLH